MDLLPHDGVRLVDREMLVDAYDSGRPVLPLLDGGVRLLHILKRHFALEQSVILSLLYSCRGGYQKMTDVLMIKEIS